MPGSPGRTHLIIRWCATCVVSYNCTSSPSSEGNTIDRWGWSQPECFLTSTLNVRVEGTSALRDIRATRGTPPNVEDQRNYSLFFRRLRVSNQDRWREWRVCQPLPHGLLGVRSWCADQHWGCTSSTTIACINSLYYDISTYLAWTSPVLSRHVQVLPEYVHVHTTTCI